MSFQDFVKAVANTSVAYPQLKAAMLAQSIMESGREDTDLAKVHNSHLGMKYRPEMEGFAVPVMYQTDSEPTGSAYFCKFETKEACVVGYWHFLTRSPYKGWTSHATTAEDFLSFICPIWCPAGYTADWATAHDGLNYHQYVLKNLLPEAEKLLAGEQPMPTAVTWYKTFPSASDKSWHSFCAYDAKGNCIDKVDAGNISDVAAFMEKYGKHTIRRGLDTEVAPTNKVPPVIPTEKTEWIPFATKIDKMARRKEVWPSYFVIHWTAGEPTQKGSDGIASGVTSGFTYCFLERSGKLFQGAPTNQGGYHAGNASVSSFDCLGVEVACAGKVEKIGDKYVPWFAKNSDGSINTARCIPASEIIYDKDDTADDGSFAGYYQMFTPEQQHTLLKMALYAVQVLGIKVENIRGHDEVATPHGRKVDPGFSICEGGMVQFRKDVSKLVSQGKTWLDFDKPTGQTKVEPPVAVLPVARQLKVNFTGALMAEQRGIQQTLDVLNAVNEIGITLVTRFKDGVGIDDIVPIFSAIVGPLKKAVEGITEVPAEVADISLQEGATLFEQQIAYIPRLIAALTK